MPRKPAKADPIDPVKVCTLALKQVKCAAEYHRIGSVNSPDVLTAAWEQLTLDEQQRITDLINSNIQPDPQIIADELTACGNKIDLQTIKKSVWRHASKSSLETATAI